LGEILKQNTEKTFLDLLKGSGAEERIGAEESIARAITHFLKNEKGSEKQLSYVQMQEILQLTTMTMLGNTTKIPVFHDFVREFLLLRVSADRKGREEIVNMIKNRLSVEESQANLKETLNKLTTSKLGGEF
jgi:predicted membrane chloride channel (bestrophin family)